METTRADFLSRGAKGGLALVAGGSVLAMTNGPAFGSVAADTDIAKLAATAELLAIDFYTRSIRSRKLKGAEAAYLAAALQNEKDALQGARRRPRPRRSEEPAVQVPGRDLRFRQEHRPDRPGARDRVRRRVPRRRQGAEDRNDLKAVAAQIGNNESRHLAILSNIAAGSIVSGPSFPKALTAAQATRALTPFLA